MSNDTRERRRASRTIDGVSRFTRNRGHGEVRDIVRLYMASLSRYPLLSKDEEFEQASRIKRLRESYRHRLLAIPEVVRSVRRLLIDVNAGKRRLDNVLDVALSDVKRTKVMRNELPRLIGDLHSIEVEHRKDVKLARSEELGDHAHHQTLERIALRQKVIRRLLSKTPVRTESLYELYRSTKSITSRCRRRIERLKTAYDAAKNRFVQHNLRLVPRTAKRFRHRGVSYLDLLQEGNAGLLRAIEKFDPDRGNKFSTYATWWIHQSIIHAVQTQGRTIRLPVPVVRQVTGIQVAYQRFVNSKQRSPSTEELAAEANLSCEETAKSIRLLRKTTSIDQADNQDGPISERVATTDDQDASLTVMQDELREVIRRAMRDLKPKERLVVTLRYGLDDGHQRTLAQVGECMSMSRENVRLIESRAFRKMRELRELASLN